MRLTCIRSDQKARRKSILTAPARPSLAVVIKRRLSHADVNNSIENSSIVYQPDDLADRIRRGNEIGETFVGK